MLTQTEAPMSGQTSRTRKTVNTTKYDNFFLHTADDHTGVFRNCSVFNRTEVIINLWMKINVLNSNISVYDNFYSAANRKTRRCYNCVRVPVLSTLL